MIFLFNYDDYQSVSNCKLEKRMPCIKLSLKAWLLCIIDVIFSIEPVMINDFSWFEISLVFIHVLYNNYTFLPVVSFLTMHKDPIGFHLIFHLILSSYMNYILLSTNFNHKGTGRSSTNGGFGPLVRFWKRSLRNGLKSSGWLAIWGHFWVKKLCPRAVKFFSHIQW